MADTGPPRDPRWAASVAALVAAIRDEILTAPGGRITFARYMERALTEPGLGYYAASAIRPTRRGDFLTAPELHPFFGRCLGRFLTAAWQHAGSPPAYRIREDGAGRGTLREGTLEGLAADGSDLRAVIEWRGLDLPERAGAPLDGPVDVVLANEFLDALPVHRLVYRGGLRELYVSWQEGWFGEVVGEPSTPELAARLAADGVQLREGQRAEVCLAATAWMADVAASLPERGLVLVIDYGHDAVELYGPRRMAGSLLTYREHEVGAEPFSAVGHTDITAHVDISALERAAGAGGLTLLGSTSQARFLSNLGLGELLARLGRQPETELEVYLEARSAVARLLDPRHLGAFRVLAWWRPGADGSVPVLPGFDDTA